MRCGEAPCRNPPKRRVVATRSLAADSGDWCWGAVVFGGTEQVELHPRNVVPVTVFPSNAVLSADPLESEGLMKTVAGPVGLGDPGEGPSVSAVSKYA